MVSFQAPNDGASQVDRQRIYDLYFHGPAYQVLDRVWVDKAEAVGLFAADLPPDMAPADLGSLMTPRLIELCFQTAGIWEMANRKRMALPMAVGSVSTYGLPEGDGHGRVYARVRPSDDGAGFDAQVVDDSGHVYVDMKGYRTVALPGEVTI